LNFISSANNTHKICLFCQFHAVLLVWPLNIKHALPILVQKPEKCIQICTMKCDNKVSHFKCVFFYKYIQVHKTIPPTSWWFKRGMKLYRKICSEIVNSSIFKTFSIDHGIIDFWPPTVTDFWLTPAHKLITHRLPVSCHIMW
jgi:hypothetical protein